jgi:purine-binding chemotaxis protein CheW
MIKWQDEDSLTMQVRVAGDDPSSRRSPAGRSGGGSKSASPRLRAGDTAAGLQLVVFRLEGQRYALPLAVVRRIVRAVEVTPLPGAPPIVLGVINVGGGILPVLNIRQRFLLPERDIAPADQFLIAHTARRVVALVIDEAHGVIERESSAVIGLDRIVPGLEQFPGVIELDDGLVLIHDLERLLSLDEARVLDEAMTRSG